MRTENFPHVRLAHNMELSARGTPHYYFGHWTYNGKSLFTFFALNGVNATVANISKALRYHHDAINIKHRFGLPEVMICGNGYVARNQLPFTNYFVTYNPNRVYLAEAALEVPAKKNIFFAFETDGGFEHPIIYPKEVELLQKPINVYYKTNKKQFRAFEQWLRQFKLQASVLQQLQGMSDDGLTPDILFYKHVADAYKAGAAPNEVLADHVSYSVRDILNLDPRGFGVGLVNESVRYLEWA